MSTPHPGVRMGVALGAAVLGVVVHLVGTGVAKSVAAGVASVGVGAGVVVEEDPVRMVRVIACRAGVAAVVLAAGLMALGDEKGGGK
jgi:hypothetical protein